MTGQLRQFGPEAWLQTLTGKKVGYSIEMAPLIQSLWRYYYPDGAPVGVCRSRRPLPNQADPTHASFAKAARGVACGHQPTYSPKDIHNISTEKTIPVDIFPECIKNIQRNLRQLILKENKILHPALIYVDNSPPPAYYCATGATIITSKQATTKKSFFNRHDRPCARHQGDHFA